MARVWDETDNQFLRENYMILSNQDLADKFGVSKKSIQGKLRRLGLHRSEGEEPEVIQNAVIEAAETPEERPLFRRRKLNVIIPEAVKEPVKRADYVPRPQTERRKRAIREFDNVMKIVESGDLKEAMDEFDFIITTFPQEYDIVEKARMYKRMLSRKAIPVPESAEEFYIRGSWHLRNTQLEEALECFKSSLDLDPEYFDASYNIACITCRLGNHDAAMDMLDKILDEHEHMVHTALYDEDFEGIWETERFETMIRTRLGEEEA